MRVLVIGKSGQLARCLADESEKRRDLELVFVGREACDVSDPSTVSSLMHGVKPKVVINTAAMTDIPACERDFDTAFRVNALGVANILDAMPDGCHLYQISTDYVFGTKPSNPTQTGIDGLTERVALGLVPPFAIEDETCPLNNYGRTKRAGELIALASNRATIIRTASLFSKYGSSGKPGNSNFLLGMLRRATNPKTVRALHFEHPVGGAYSERDVDVARPTAVDSDVIMSPTYTPWLARCILELIERGQKPPLAHIVCEGPPVLWFNFAKAIFEIGEFPEALSRLAPKQADGWPPRPHFSALKNSLQHIHMGTWRSALEHFFANEWPTIKEGNHAELGV